MNMITGHNQGRGGRGGLREDLKDITILVVYTIINNSKWSLSKKREKSYDFEINLIRQKGITLNR